MRTRLLFGSLALLLSACGGHGGPAGSIPATSMSLRAAETPSNATRIVYYNLGASQSDGVGDTIYAAPDGKIYYGDSQTGNPNSSNLGRFDPATGTSTEVPIAGAPQELWQTTDGAIWATVQGSSGTVSSITRLAPFTPAGLTQIAAPTIGVNGSDPTDLTQGPDGNIWFTLYCFAFPNPCDVGTIPASGPYTTGAIKTFTVPNGPYDSSEPYGIASGADGNLWFTDVANGIVYKMTTAGVMTPFPTPEEQRGKATFPGIIRAASDGNLYYYDQQEDHFHSISTNGTYATIGVTTTPGTSSFMVQSAGSGSVLFGTGGITVYDTATRKSVILPTTHRFGPRPHAVASETVAPDGSIWFLCLLARAPGQPICLGHLLLTSTWSLFPSGATHLDINKRTHPGWATELIGIGESGNSGPFTAASSNSAVVTVSKITPSGYTHNFLITGTSVGSATVTIRDAHGRSAPIPVSVTN